MTIIIILYNHHNNDNVPLRQDREDALPRGTECSWIMMIIIIIMTRIRIIIINASGRRILYLFPLSHHANRKKSTLCSGSHVIFK